MSFDVLMLSSAHDALDDRIFYREARTLSKAGYSVCVVANHPKSVKIEGIHIVALKRPASRIKRLLASTTIFILALRLHGRLFIIHDPELIGVGFALRLSGKKVFYDIHENLPAQILQKTWMPTSLRRLLVPIASSVEWLAGQLLSGIIAAVPAIQERFPASRTILARNFPTREALTTLGSGTPISSRTNRVIYTGGLSRIRGTLELVEAFRELPDAELWLVGDFDDPAFRNEITSRLPHNVKWLGRKTHPEVLELYRHAKLGAVLLHPTPNHRCALPVKLFEYLGAGLPVIASNFPEYSPFIQGCGVQVDPFDVKEIRQTISHLISDSAALEEMSARCRQNALTLYSWESEGIRLVEFCAQRLSEQNLLAHPAGLSRSLR